VKIDVRKLISFGKGSFIISMPKEWVEKNNLKKGDIISISDNGMELTISAGNPEAKQELKEINIDAKGKELGLLKTEIVSSYLNNYDTIHIVFDQNYKDVPKIKDIIRNLSGLEIMEQTSSRIVAKSLININEISIKNIIRRMDIITRAMMEDAILCSRGQYSDDSIHHRDADVNRLYFLGYRVTKNAMKNPRVAKSLDIGPWQLHSDTMMLLRLEKIADRQKRIARYLSDVHLEKETIVELDKVHAEMELAYNDVMKAYYNQDKQIALRTELTNKSRTDSCTELLEKCTNNYSQSKKKLSNANIVAIAKVIENIKATHAEIKNIARTILCYE